jgi:hypothetical protein
MWHKAPAALYCRSPFAFMFLCYQLRILLALWEEYRDKAALEAHIVSDHFQKLVLNGIRPLAKERNGAMIHPI